MFFNLLKSKMHLTLKNVYFNKRKRNCLSITDEKAKTTQRLIKKESEKSNK